MLYEIIGIVLALIAFNHYWWTSTFRFWRDRGVVSPKPTQFIGNLGSILTGKMSIGGLVKHYYEIYKNEPFVGIYVRGEPNLVLRDLDLIRDVFISDFSNFSDRQITVFEKSEPLTQNLLNLEFKRWRPLRNCLSPVFTSGKLKEMFHLILNCGENLEKYMDELIEKNNIIDARELSSRFTIDVIGVCAFGLDVKAMAEEDNEFRRMGKLALSIDLKKVLWQQIKEAFPSFFEFLAPIFREELITDFFTNTMKDTMSYRRKNNIIRRDFLQFLMEIQDNPEKLPGIKITDTLLAAQLFLFFLAGFDTSSTTISHALYELAQRQDYQDKLREEIEETLKANDGKLTYDSIKNMKFLDKVFKETLRKHAPIPLLKRGCNTDYTFSGTNVTIPTGTAIMIPMRGIHYDPKLYPNPEEFNPDNFSEEAIQSRHSMSWLAFGDGPRNCIGMRFAHQQSKVGIIKILERYRVDVCEKTDIPYKINPKNFLLEPLNGIQLKFIKINSNSST